MSANVTGEEHLLLSDYLDRTGSHRLADILLALTFGLTHRHTVKVYGEKFQKMLLRALL